MSADFKQYLRSQQTLVEEFLRTQLVADGGCPAKLAEAMRYSLLGGGKRLRPILVLMANEAAGGSEPNR